jgi:diguanylate cyclase (GGDEF)-like protein
MPILESQLSDRSSDHQVLIATAVSALAALLTLVLELAGQLNWLDTDQRLAAWVELGAEIFCVAAFAWASTLALKVMAARRSSSLSANKARDQVETLFRMADMLQSALGHADANAVLTTTASKLLPGFGGALYVFNNSGDRLELSSSWSLPPGHEPVKAIAPTQCWALKRGKTHINLAGMAALRCAHHCGDDVALEIPMMARGEVYGLLQVRPGGSNPEAELAEAAPVAGAIADAMSLALSNIALREKLRTQALRDPLTGLYNRRYMEDVLERYAVLAERNQTTLAAIMFDLDHFKRLNDEHGHAMGDSVLAGVAATVLGTIRPSDVACRYGGEEFVVLLPDCSLDDAMNRAEALRARIERLSENHGVPVSASFGVVSIPDTSAKVSDLLGDADQALYRAKAEGRNCVVPAARKPVRSIPEPRAAA